MSRLLADLTDLRVEAARTAIDRNDFEPRAFLEVCGFAPSRRPVFTRAVPA